MNTPAPPEANATVALARFASAFERTHLSDADAAVVRASLLDWLGCCVAGAMEPPVCSLDAVLGPMAGAAQASLLVRGRRASILDAAMLNAAAGCVHDLDDLHAGIIAHPAAVIAPAVLALGESLGAPGSELVAAYAVGFEVMVRIGLAVEPELYQRGWHATGVLGVFGACAGACRLLRLGEARTVAALGIAATQASGLRELMGTAARCIHQGRAASAGVLAALWAAQGVASCADPIDGRYGLRVLSGTLRPEAIRDGLGRRLHLHETAYKRHAASGSLHAAIDAAIALRNAHGVSPDAVDRVVVRVHPLALDLCAPHADPADAFSAKQSLHMAVALALKEGRCDLDLFTPSTLADPTVRALRARVSASADPSMQYVEAMPAEIVLVTRDGDRLVRRVDVPKGRPSHPMSWPELVSKFDALAAATLGDSRRRAVVEAVERLDATTVPSLLAPLAGT